MNELVLRPPFDRRWAGRDPFAEVAAMGGETVRHKEGRETRRCLVEGEVFYRKVHSGVGWGEIFKNLLQGRLPVVDASNEWRAIQRLGELGIPTLTPVAWGRRGLDPATRQSFLVTRELTGTLSTAVFTATWPASPPAHALRVAMIRRIAAIARALHGAGINHRDLYLCHFLLDVSAGVEQLDPARLRFYLVDLHRAQIRRRVPRRWRVKDVASLYFSALDIGLTRRDVLRFLRAYFQQPLKTVVAEQASLLRAVEGKADKLYRRDFGRAPVFPIHAP
ncbi:MAG: lipopolysaccharide core heptose(I) kinase RfaP [Porticoccaceae bacterium]|jgi:heptose I phosphotransferase|nr:lipopolysaccharide core heptose(I) kinase RfaP [Porticoccaceae bacterium]